MNSKSITWSTDEMIKNAEHWSLAGDVALLNSLKTFSEKILTETVNISSNVDNLLNNLYDVSLKLDLTKNEFHSLRNTQFIENRVYEDDETLETSQEKNEEKDKQVTAEEKDKILNDSIARSLKVIDKYFDKVEVSVSDSEEETEKSYVLRPKDLYIERPLPFLIGSQQWIDKWHVGLADSSSESESEKEEEDVYSESGSEDDLPKNLVQIKSSETSSELEFSSSRSASNGPVANSTFNDSIQRPKDIFHSSEESEDANSVPVKSPLSNQNFAAQLAAKLGTVVSQQEHDVPVNKNPIKPEKKIVGGLFSDEPPPLDDFEDTILPKQAQGGIFSGGKGLFDDDDEGQSFWGQNITSTAGDIPSHTEKPVNEIRSEENLTPNAKHRGLFDSEGSDDDDIFFTNKRQSTAPKPYLTQPTTTAPLFSEEPPEIEPDTKKNEPEITNKKKPVGGVSVFGNSDLLADRRLGDILKNQENISEATKEEENEAKRKTTENIEENSKISSLESKKNKKIKLFDDDDDGFGTDDDLFKNATRNLFDDVKNPLKVENISKIRKNLGLFDTSSSEDEQQHVPTGKKSSLRKQNGLFDSSSSEKEEDFNVSVEKKTDISVQRATDRDNNQNGEVSIVQEEEERGLIKEEDVKTSKEDKDYPFEENKSKITDTTGNNEEINPPSIKVEEASPILNENVAKQAPRAVNIFDPNPPPDDDWDTGDVSDADETFSYQEEYGTQRSSLFDNEPPSLDPNESSGIVRDQSAVRVETDDSSFNPYASSSRRLSSDIFNEQQSNDSFFVTKNKTDSSAIFPNLQSIPETTLNTDHFDITPSGNADDFSSVFERSNADSKQDLIEKSTRKPLSLFNSDNENSDDDDLFSFKPKRNNPNSDSSLFYGAGDGFEKNTSKIDESPSSGDTVDAEIKNEKDFSKNVVKNISGLVEKLSNQQEDTKEKNKDKGSPGKLKHNLNINVGALLPGKAPPISRVTDKSDDRDRPVGGASNTTNITSNHDEKPINFEEDVAVLHSITKDRPRMPVKRRPSTRRGRQESAKISAIEDAFTFVQQENTEKTTESRIETTEIEKNEVSNETKPFEQANVETSVANKTKSGIFDSEEEDDDLFGAAKTRVVEKDKKQSREPTINEFTVKNEKKQVSLFSDSPESDDDLFGGREKSAGGNTKKIAKKKSLFDDDDTSDDDLFGSTSSKQRNAHFHQQSVPERNVVKSTTIKRLQNQEVDDDPLSSLLK